MQQVLSSAARSDHELLAGLGPSHDLLVWIPKEEGADHPEALRGLQLPTCWRRVFGAILAATVAPLIEPHLSISQTGVRHGECCTNIREAFNHLGSPDQQPPPTTQLWTDLLGPLADPVREVAAMGDPDNACDPAVVFADQNKAFERLSHGWLRRVMTGWRMPDWTTRAFLPCHHLWQIGASLFTGRPWTTKEDTTRHRDGRYRVPPGLDARI